MAQGKTVFSGEPLPIAPRVPDAELENFHRKLLDYLRRLGAKIDHYLQPSTPGNEVQCVMCYLDTDKVLGASYAPIVWTDSLRVDAAFSFSAGQVSVTEDGFYLILVDIDVGDNGYFLVEAKIVIGSPDFVPTFGYGVIGPNTGSLAISLPLPAGKTIDVHVRCVDSPDVRGIKSAKTRLTILRLHNEFGGGDGDPPGDGWTDPNDDGFPPWAVAEI